jgi:N-hydroxyarylamine O-acetyltransferase
MNIQNYLKRLKIDSPMGINKESLFLLHQQHLLTIPFENLDIYHGIPIRFDVEDFYNKIITKNRGGFCYELNVLFAELLKTIGFKTYFISARLWQGKDNYGPEFGHIAIIVELGSDQWLIDVGMGESFAVPIKISQNSIDEQQGKFYNIRSKENGYLELRKLSVYLFSSFPRTLNTFREMFFYHQSSPNSKFTQRCVCSIATADGRITLTESKLIITKGENRTIRGLENDEYESLLQQHFNISFNRKLKVI